MVGLSRRWNLLQSTHQKSLVRSQTSLFNGFDFHIQSSLFKMKYERPLFLFKTVKEHNKIVPSSERIELLAFDTGEVYTGLAVTDLVLIESWPYKVINMSKYKGPRELANYLEEMISKWKIGGLLVGYSAMMHNLRLEEEHRARVFKWLKAAHESPNLVNFPFTFVDERNSSKEAKKILNGWDPAPRDYNRELNRVAANVFTQRWLNNINYGLFDKNSRLEKHLESVGDYWNNNHWDKLLAAVSYHHYLQKGECQEAPRRIWDTYSF